MADLHILHDTFQQSPWLDNLSRHLLDEGRIAKLIDEGIRGLTSNPTIFEKAFADSDAYDAAIASSGLTKNSVQQLYWELAIADIQRTADLLKPVFDDSKGQDGFVSLEVSPELAHDATATIAQAHELWQKIDRPNLMIKVPATEDCLPAIKQLIADGLNVNVTLIFSLERYQRVIEAYMDGLESHEGPLDNIHSVASFFISRVDSEVDARLAQLGGEHASQLAGQAGVAQARLAYQLFSQSFTADNPRWSALQARSAAVQRPLWASTSVKNPAYDPLLYVKSLLAPSTVNTLPDVTIEAIQHAPYDAFSHETGITAEGLQQAQVTLSALADVGVNMSDVTNLLETEGVQKFHGSFMSMLATLSAKMPE
jgi:transaldolase